MKKRILAIVLSLALLLPVGGLAANAGGNYYTIGNPYADVNWDTWHSVKAQLHVHTNASDGADPRDVVIEDHYRLGYDALCLTDHMTLGVPWNEVPKTVPIMRLVKYDRTQMLPVTKLTDARRQEMLDGVGRGGRGMMEITQGAELNGAVPSNTHLQGFFSDYGQGQMGVDGDWETPVKGVQAAGGLTTLNHLGEPTGAEDANDPEFYDKNPQWVDKFAYLFYKYSSCIGMDINSGTNDGTKYDDLLYDKILLKTIPYGVVPWAFTYSDAHGLGQFDRAFTVHMMPAKTPAELRKSMEKGTFFGAARHARRILGDSFTGEGPVPAVKAIAVDEAAGTITIAAENCDSIAWVYDGKVVATGGTLSLAAHNAEIGCYVRAYLTGDGGILYTQPFTVSRAGETLPKVPINRVIDLSVFLRFLVDGIFVFAPKYSPIWFLWSLLTQFDPAIDLACLFG